MHNVSLMALTRFEISTKIGLEKWLKLLYILNKVWYSLDYLSLSLEYTMCGSICKLSLLTNDHYLGFCYQFGIVHQQV